MIYDALIVGGSYAGLSAAMILARARRQVAVVDSRLPRNRFTRVGHGFFGQDGKAPYAILQEAREQLLAYPSVTYMEGEAISAAQDGTAFMLHLEDGQILAGRRLVLATGLRDELPPVSGLAERWGVGVAQCPYCHGYEAGGQPLGVLASHPMAVHQALMIPDWGPTTLFTQNFLEPDAEQVAKLDARGVRVERTPIAELLGPGQELESVRLADGRLIPLKALFIQPKTFMASPLAAQLGCAFEEGMTGAFLRVDDFKQTSVPGVYAAGDATTPFHNATFAAASGTAAGVGAHQSLMAEAAQPSARHE